MCDTGHIHIQAGCRTAISSLGVLPHLPTGDHDSSYVFAMSELRDGLHVITALYPFAESLSPNPLTALQEERVARAVQSTAWYCVVPTVLLAGYLTCMWSLLPPQLVNVAAWTGETGMRVASAPSPVVRRIHPPSGKIPETFLLWQGQFEPRSMAQCIGQEARRFPHSAPSLTVRRWTTEPLSGKVMTGSSPLMFPEQPPLHRVHWVSGCLQVAVRRRRESKRLLYVCVSECERVRERGLTGSDSAEQDPENP